MILGWSAICPHDYFTWFLEVVPALIGLAVLAVAYPRFRFTNLVYALICAQAIILWHWRSLHRVAVGTGSRADDFLGTQGDNWDTREDMATALLASLIALITLGRVHDRLLRQYEPETNLAPVSAC